MRTVLANLTTQVLNLPLFTLIIIGLSPLPLVLPLPPLLWAPLRVVSLVIASEEAYGVTGDVGGTTLPFIPAEEGCDVAIGACPDTDPDEAADPPTAPPIEVGFDDDEGIGSLGPDEAMFLRNCN